MPVGAVIVERGKAIAGPVRADYLATNCSSWHRAEGIIGAASARKLRRLAREARRTSTFAFANDDPRHGGGERTARFDNYLTEAGFRPRGARPCGCLR